MTNLLDPISCQLAFISYHTPTELSIIPISQLITPLPSFSPPLIKHNLHSHSAPTDFNLLPKSFFTFSTQTILQGSKTKTTMGVGISVLIGLKATALLLFFAYLRSLGFTLLSAPFLYASLVSFLVSIASHPSIDLPMLLGKNPDGTFPIWSLIMFSPYLYFVRFFSALRRLRSGEPPYTQVHDGLYVGGWPSSREKLPPGDPAIVDCTCEFPRLKEIYGLPYRCVLTWDTRSPQPADIESAVKWACHKRDLNRPVFVHCAYGHGRSVAVMCALLVALGITEDWKTAEKLIKQKRPYIRMNALHRRALEEWSKHRLSTPKKH